MGNITNMLRRPFLRFFSSGSDPANAVPEVDNRLPSTAPRPTSSQGHLGPRGNAVPDNRLARPTTVTISALTTTTTTTTSISQGHRASSLSRTARYWKFREWARNAAMGIPMELPEEDIDDDNDLFDDDLPPQFQAARPVVRSKWEEEEEERETERKLARLPKLKPDDPPGFRYVFVEVTDRR